MVDSLAAGKIDQDTHDSEARAALDHFFEVIRAIVLDVSPYYCVLRATSLASGPPPAARADHRVLAQRC